MPELPEVETVCKGLEPVLVRNTVSKVNIFREGLRFPFPDRFEDRIFGRKILSLNRRAKYLLATLDSNEILTMHLGMSGRFIIKDKSLMNRPGAFEHDLTVNPKHDHVVFEMNNGVVVKYNDARRFGFMTLIPADKFEEHKLFRHLGVEPLGNGFTADFLAARARSKKVSLKSFLMDQRIVAGLGNIYVCEALYRAKLSPKRKASTLSVKRNGVFQRAEILTNSVRSVLEEAIKAGGSTLRDHRQADGSLGYFQHRFSVYGREGEVCAAPDCSAMVRRITQNGRSTFYCPQCQH